jgi:hypothetical protein
MDGIHAYEGMRYWGYSTRELSRNQISIAEKALSQVPFIGLL